MATCRKFYIIKLWRDTNRQLSGQPAMHRLREKKKKKVTMAYISSCVVASHFPNQHKDQLSHLWQLVSVQRRILKGQTWVLQVSQQDNLCLQKLQLEYDMLHWGQKKWAQDHVCEAHQFLQGSSGHHHRHHRC